MTELPTDVPGPSESTATAARPPVRRLDAGLVVWTGIVLLAYFVAILAGITSTSIGTDALRATPGSDAANGVAAGKPRPIRSDDFLRSTPWAIGLVTSEGDAPFSPLAHPGGALVTPGAGGFVSSVVFPEATVTDQIGRVAPRQAFAASWWFPLFLTLVLAPIWFRMLGTPAHIGIPIALLVVLTPATAWWSWAPAAACTWGFVTATAALVAGSRIAERRWKTAALAVALAGLGFSRLVLGYQAWTISVALIVLVPTLVFLIRQRGWRLGVLVSGSVVVLGAALSAAYLHEQADAFEVLVGTVYPGSRRSIGMMLDAAQLFGAPHLWPLQNDIVLANTNQSELSSGFLILGVVAALMAASMTWRRAGTELAIALSALAVVGVLATWCTITWPAGAERLFPLSLISPQRMGQFIGIPAAIAFGLMLTAWIRSSASTRIPTSIVAASATFFVTAYAGSAFRGIYAPTYRTTSIALVAIIAALCILCAVALPRRTWALVPMTLAAAATMVVVNPLQQGFGDLRDSEPAREIRALGDGLKDGETWASDDYYMDAYLMANSQRSLSGQQWVGPSESAWRKLDPDGTYEDVWNRGASFIRFVWNVPGSPTEIKLVQADLMDVVVDPCSADLQSLGLRLISSGRPLTDDCVSEVGSISFGGTQRYLYEIDRSRAATDETDRNS